MYSIPPVKTMDQLIRILHTGPGYDGYVPVLHSIKFGIREIEKFCNWNKEQHSKIVIEKMPSTELILICWEKGQRTSIHDHAHRESWFVVIDGALTETVFYKPGEFQEPLQIASTNTYGIHDVGYMTDNHGLHRLENSHDGRTVSIHLYSEAFGIAKQYDEATGKEI